MTSTSRSTNPTLALGSVHRNVNKASDAYSDSLMDDLFGDVDRILDGDLSSCMTFVKPQQAVRASSSGTRTVQLPANFSPKSAADICRVTMAAGTQQQTHHGSSSATNYTAAQAPLQTPLQTPVAQPQVVSPSIYHQPTRRPTAQTATGYRRGGRPMTSFSTSAAKSGNFQSTVIQTPSQQGPGTTIDVHISSETDNIYAQAPRPELDPNHVSPRPPQTIFEPNSFGDKQPVSLPFLLMGAAGISVASTLGLWALGNNTPGGLLAFNTEASAAEIPNSDADFLVYLQKSLENISANHPTAGQQHTLSAVIPAAAPAVTVPTTVPHINAAPTTAALPNLPGAAANAPTASTAPSVIERVFVPVYESQQNGGQQNARQQPATAQADNPSTNASLPNITTANVATAPRPTVPVPAPVAAAAAIPPGAPAAAAASAPIVPVGNATLPTPTEIAVAPTNSAVTGLTDTTPYSEQVLVGVLNLGSRSAALFDVDGTSQRAYVGDRIGTSEWSLVSVNGQDVVIRRDGEVRSVYIGQRF